MKLTLGEKLHGPAGEAQEVLIELEPDDPRDQTATLGHWFLDCPGQSPAWRHYGLSVIHLRDIEGAKSAHKRFPEATHEVVLLAYDPEGNPDPLDPTSWNHLIPTNLEEQVKLHDDQEAKDLLKLCVKGVLDGLLWAEPPLSGQVEPWRSALTQTAEHARGEHLHLMDGTLRGKGFNN